MDTKDWNGATGQNSTQSAEYSVSKVSNVDVSLLTVIFFLPFTES